jgi:acyl-CoA synthetase (AMP-forming)/AMP-acid ligase II
MKGLMQEHELLISSVIRHAAENHGDREVVTREPDGRITRSCYARVEQRARQLAAALTGLGIRPGYRVATLAMNSYRHLECYYGISGMGAVLHTVNPRLFAEQITYIVNHGQSRALLLDPCFLPLVNSIATKLRTVEHFIVLTESALMPPAGERPMLCYEQLLDGASGNYQWPSFDERTAASLCYTSGTTGQPKGVLYSHRSTLLHALVSLQADCFGLRSVDTVLPIVPMFHVHAWSMPYGCAMAGAKLVLPGNHVDAPSLAGLIQSEQVTMALGVPTVWAMLVNHLRDSGQSLPSLQRAVVGGAALPPAIRDALEQVSGARVIHAWGMTETSPTGTVSTTTANLERLSADERRAELLKQGRPPWGVELKITNPEGEPLPADSASSGQLWIRGPWIARSYFRRGRERVLDDDGWFPTGDVASRDAHGFIKISDRTKDVIKSGGEWISSIDIENIATTHPQVKFAAAIAAEHPKWGERPILIVVPADGGVLSAEELLEYLRPRMAKWWLPDAIVFLSELPLTATGKILKSSLRAAYREYLL